ncbi:YwpF-like family protein [Virgibacillus sp. MSJ-26]|uniref:YwpF-like family protein n=1 Tax=Virgibacillus sp. MSJ-26 TaxID=2841522 RepID=UPI001C1159BB|nr:YwpF-like family protein [Virgibacillus sp. MSJ-26]MBU5467108.1 YwpF-like family protein [Virgibacillus sp. MSJ-26]
MKTFKLNSLSILLYEQEEIKKHPIEFIDGLMINREDEEGQWLTEVYLDKQHKDLFQQLKDNNEQTTIEVKITKESNAPVTLNSRILGLNDIGDFMNVLLIGEMVDRRKSMVEDLLSNLITKGYQGEELLKRFKELV